MNEAQFQLVLDYITSRPNEDKQKKSISLSLAGLTSFPLNNASLTKDQLRRLADCLSLHKKYLTDISLVANNIDDETAVYLIRCMYKDCALILCDLSNNPISLNAKQYINFLLTDNIKSPGMAAYSTTTIKLYYWQKSQKIEQIRNFSNAHHTGHVALEIFTETGKYIYVSYWPKSSATCITMWHTKAKLVSKQSELKNHPNYTEILLDDFDLNLDKIVDRFFITYHRWKTQETWSIVQHNCATRVVELLKEGGFLENFPAIDQFGSIRYLLLLCYSRIFISIALLGSGFYPFPFLNEPYFHETSKGFLAALSFIVFNGTTIFMLERKFENNQLIESNKWDCVIGLSASLGFGVGSIIHKKFINPIIDDSLFQATKLLDLLLLPATAAGMILFGKITSYLIDLMGGKGHTITPNNIASWVEYLKNSKKIDVKAREYVFYKNLSFAVIFYTAWIVTYTARNFVSRDIAMGIGIIGGVSFGYILVKILHHLTLIKKYLPRLKEEDLAFIQLHDKNLEKHVILSITTLLGIVGTVSYCNSQAVQKNDKTIANPFLESILAPLGGTIGFMAGVCAYYIFSKMPSNQNQYGIAKTNINDKEDSSNSPSEKSPFALKNITYNTLPFFKKKEIYEGEVKEEVHPKEKRSFLSCTLL